MNAPDKALRRGTCPGLSAPMQTGDGLLVRLAPRGDTMRLDAVTALCAAARRHGNGIVEITARGNIQVRGLAPASAPDFADAIAALGIAAPDGVPILVDPLAGLEPEQSADAIPLAAALRQRLAAAAWTPRLGPKVSVIIDGGAALHLDVVAADIRLRAEPPTFSVSVGGTAENAMPLGAVEQREAVDVAVRILETIACAGPSARGRDFARDDGPDRLREALAGLAIKQHVAEPRPRAEPIGLHLLRDRNLALGVGLAFGHTDADTLERLIAAAHRAGAAGLRTSPDRALLVIGIAPAAATILAAGAESLGFITRSDDPRRRVVACAGAPICACGHIPARALAPAISAAAARLDGAATIHVSGCRKGCARPGTAALTIVGTERGCDLIANGSVHDRPFASVPTQRLLTEVAEIARSATRLGEPSHG